MSASIELGHVQRQPSIASRLRAACIVLSRPIAFLGVIGMLIASGVTVLDVLLRWLVNGGITALNEIISMTFAVAITACIPAGLASGVGVTIDATEKLLGIRAAAAFKTVGAFLLFSMFAVLTWRMSIYADSLYAEGRTTIILGLPQAPFLWATAVLLGIATLVQLIVAIDLAGASRAAPSIGLPAPSEIAAWCILGLMVLSVLGVAIFFDPVSHWAQDHPVTTVLAGFILMWLWLGGLVPLAATIGLVGLGGTALLIGLNPALSAFAVKVSGFLTNYEIASLPLFLMMGSFAAVAGVSDDMYKLAQALLGRFRGGLAMATIGACAGFGSVTGSSLATVATFGRVSLPQMEMRAYAPQFAAGCVAAGGTLGALIPPSGPLIIFALLTNASIGQLFVAAIIPGVLAALLYLFTVSIVVRLDPKVAPPAEAVATRQLLRSIRQCSSVVILFGAVIGGMYTGVFTATEAAAVGAFGAFLIALVRGKLHAGQFWQVMSETTASTALIYTLIFGVVIFSLFVGASALPEAATAFVGGLKLPHLMIIMIILLTYLLLGSVMDSFTVMMITVPIVSPLIVHMGYDVVWWGIINLVIVETGLITPPFGMHLFVLKSMLPKVRLQEIYRGVLPFCAADAVKLFLLMLFPILALWIPSTMGR